MILLNEFDLSLPLKNPVVIFSLVLFIILFAPILLNRLKIPHIIGLIVAGIVVGPYGANLLLRDSSIVLFGTVGLLYIMFTAGLEIDLEEFRKNRVKSFVFGLYTFLTPMVFGTLTAYYVLQFSLPSALLLAGMFASHTLLAYPITSKYGISRIRSVTLTIGGTIITDILALLVLAAVTGMTKGEIGASFWIRLAISTVIFGIIVFLLFPVIARWFFKSFNDHISQYIFVLAMVFLGSFLAEAAGLEAIIGAFLSGLALNRFIPHSSALMNRIEFVGNAFFIPFFLIGVGMLVDFSVLFKGLGALKVAGVMTVLAILTKYVAAWLTQKSFRLSPDERKMIFGLSTARVGATLAVVLVGYNIIVGETAGGEPIRLLNEDVLNGTILMILITCTISSFLVERSSQKLALLEENKVAEPGSDEKILISLGYPDTVTELVDLGLMLKPKSSLTPVYALTVISDGTNMHSVGKKALTKAVSHAASSGNAIIPLTRFDVSVSNGIVYTIMEQKITDIIIGLHHDANPREFFGNITDHLLKRTPETVYIYKSTQPFNTLKRMVVAVSPKAELEPGFSHWFFRLCNIAKEGGMPIDFYAAATTVTELKDQHKLIKSSPKINYHIFDHWEDFLIFTREVKRDDLFIIISSRKAHVSYQNSLEKLPYYLSNYFSESSFIIVYPKQIDYGIRMGDVQHFDSTLAETITEKVGSIGKAGNFLKKVFKKN
jgi:Kef-type K+ transport system membrane component KefB